MYIIVRKNDNIIIGSAIGMINTNDAESKGYDVYEIPSSEFSKDMIGAKLEGFEEIK